MATVKCEKVKINIPKGKELELLDKLHSFGKTELIKRKIAHLEHPNLEEERAKLLADRELLQKALKTLSPYLPKQNFLDKISDNRVIVKEVEIQNCKNQRDAILLEASQIEEKVKKMEELKKTTEELESFIAQLEPFKDVEVPLFEEHSAIFVLAFSVGAADKDGLIADIKQNYVNIELSAIKENEDKSYFIIIGPKEDQKEISDLITSRANVLKSKYFAEGDSLAVLNAYKADLSKVIKEKEELQQSVKKEVNEMDKFLILGDILKWETQKLYTLDVFDDVGDHYLVEFWVEPDYIKDLHKLVSEIDSKGHVSVYSNIPAKDKRVTLKNLNFFKSFEIITNTMGYPGAEELDPTPILTPFFILFFGLALSDAGYGLILAGLTGFILKTRRLKEGVKKMLTVIFWCGISTIVFGALLGSWFGFVPDYYQATSGNGVLSILNPVIDLLKAAMLIDPVLNIPLMLGIMVSLGIIHLLTGYIAAFIAKVYHGKTLAGLLDDLVPAFFIISLVVFALTNSVSALNAYGAYGTYFVYAMLVAMVVSKGRSAGIFGMIPVGILQTFMASVGLLSETLSYARLLALGIATGVIAGVINTLAMLTVGTPIIGPLFVIIVLLIGHTINILLNLLGSYINAGRLQFVEFFPKFMSAAGKPLIPFRRAEENVIISK